MQDIFPDRIPQLLEQLAPDTPPQWGRMDAQRMVEHLTNVLRLSVGAISLKLYTPEEKLEKAKRGLLTDRPFPREYQAPFLPADPVPTAFADLAAAKTALLRTIEDFNTFYADKDESFRLPHPIFGPLNGTEWRHFHNKHFNHHFGQFGLVKGEG